VLDKKTIIYTVERYAEAVKQEFKPSAVILFGSHINGNPHENSDIDVGVVFDDFIGDRRKTWLRLWHLAYDISWDIEPHFLDNLNDKSGFVKHVFKTGHIIYQNNLHAI
jgi:predicted nucleotidyltransferase